MIKSMTGFGMEAGKINDKKVIVEIRSLNSKSFDANLRLPSKFRGLEPDLRIMLGKRIERGKLDFYLTIENDTDFSEYKVNQDLARHYLSQLKNLAREEGLDITPDVLPAILRLPDVVTQSPGETNEDEKQILLDLTRIAIEKLELFRTIEGKALGQDFSMRISKILELLKRTEPFESQRIEDIRHRLRSDLVQIEQRVQIDNNRFEQEIIYYLEKIDFTEEKIRLEKHCRNFLETMSENESQGRKLGFITQEIGREINTLGSKAYNADIQKIVVDMKNELEKIKEQLLNIL
jgi:uncharacterized protein (TIGR00255 family)